MIALLLLSLLAADPQTITGKVVAVTDGDTIVVLCDREQVKVRLAGIDAPEKKQPFGTKSREHLAEMCHEKEVTVEVSGKDRYGRSIGVVMAGEINVNESMVESGLAWRYVRYSKSERLAKFESDARAAKRGLWADKEPVPPWEWRKNPK